MEFQLAINAMHTSVCAIRRDTTPMNDHPEYESNAKQYQWLAQGLAASQATWVVVCGHHPIFSSAAHGSTPALVNYVLPLLIKCVYSYTVAVSMRA